MAAFTPGSSKHSASAYFVNYFTLLSILIETKKKYTTPVMIQIKLTIKLVNT